MVIFQAKIIPQAKRDQIVGYENDILKIKVNAPAEKNKANKELIYFLSKTFCVSRSDITILSGETSRLKKIKIENLSKEDLDRIIETLLV